MGGRKYPGKKVANREILRYLRKTYHPWFPRRKTYRGLVEIYAMTVEALQQDNSSAALMGRDRYGEAALYSYHSIPCFDSGDYLWDSLWSCSHWGQVPLTSMSRMTSKNKF